MNSQERPIIFSEGKNEIGDLASFRASHRIWKEIDIYEGQLRELFQITHPELLGSVDADSERRRFLEEKGHGQEQTLRGDWVYFPWSGILLHTVGPEDSFALRTNRNRDLITREEQKILSDFCVGIVGLSVGSNVATALAYTGIANTMKLAEFDTLETTNLNRIRARIDQIGMKKLEIAAQQVYEINPYAVLACFSEGLTRETLTRFVCEDPKPQLIFEIMDSFEMKIHLRSLAKERGIPVIMVTNLGDRVLLDVERYDLDRNTEFFNGRAGTVPDDILGNPDVTAEQKHVYAVSLAGAGHIPQRALESVEKIGTILVGRPQLASTVTVAAGFCAYLVRKIALGDHVSGSWLIDFDALFRADTAL